MSSFSTVAALLQPQILFLGSQKCELPLAYWSDGAEWVQDLYHVRRADPCLILVRTESLRIPLSRRTFESKTKVFVQLVRIVSRLWLKAKYRSGCVALAKHFAVKLQCVARMEKR